MTLYKFVIYTTVKKFQIKSKKHDDNRNRNKNKLETKYTDVTYH